MTTAALRRFLLPVALLTAAAVTGCSAGNDGASPSQPPAATGSETAQAQTASSLTANDLEEGQCVTDSGTAAEPDIQLMPCGEPHAFEVFATTELGAGKYPGLGEADAQAQEFCRGEFTAFIGVEYDASALDLQYFYPVESDWTGDGGRSVICLVGSAGGEPSTGTLRDSRQ